MPSVNNISATPNQTPLLTPNFDQAVVNGRTLGLSDEVDILVLGDGVRAAGTFTVGTAGSQNDILRVTIRGVPVEAVVPGSPTTTNVAAALAAAINKKAELAGVVSATSAAAVVTVTAAVPGTSGNKLTLALGTSSGTTAASVSAQMTGGTGTIITPLETITVQVGINTVALKPNRPVLASQGVFDAIVASGKAYR
jgi:hypothetical protein